MSMNMRSKLTRSSQTEIPASCRQTTVEESERSEPASSTLTNLASITGPSVEAEQALLIAKLRQRVADLEGHEHDTVTIAEYQRVQSEWQTSEDLLRGSQRDNELKHETIEQYKIYIKVLEGIIEAVAGADWKSDHQIRPPLSQPAVFSASTPLPKPSLSVLRRSVSIVPSAKRSSRSITRHVSVSDFGPFNNIQMAFAHDARSNLDETPSVVIRKIIGKSTSVVDTRSGTNAHTAALPTSQHTVTALDPSRPRTTDSAEAPSRSGRPLSSVDSADMKALVSVLDSSAEKPIDSMLAQTLRYIETAEQDARARQARLEAMLQVAQSSA